MAIFFRFFIGCTFWTYHHKWLLLAALIASLFIALAGGKLYQNWDDDSERGALAIDNGAFGESYSTPIYLDQGWDESDSLWFYNTTQGSGLMPYDFFLVLEEADSQELMRSAKIIDKYRYLPQKPTFFNPDGLPVGMVKDSYQGKDYMGYTCAACHTGQVNYKGQAIRIDGGSTMADMVGFLSALEKSMLATLNDAAKQKRFVTQVLALENDFDEEHEIIASLQHWTQTIGLYNTVNHSQIDYGYARLDAFGRIYNRVLQHMINKTQLANAMKLATSATGNRILTDSQISNVLNDIGENILVDKQFTLVLERLTSTDPGFPGLSQRELLRVRNEIFNEPNAPVSYPFLWDISHSDYVQWNGLAHNARVGPLGRNTGEVIGVFGILDWTAHKPKKFSLSASLTGQKKKREFVRFKSSVNKINLRRLENHLKSLKSPLWPEDILGKIDFNKAERGQTIYAEYCQSCHAVIDRENWDRLIVANMIELDFVGTDKAAAINGVSYKGKSGNFENTIQATEVGNLVIQEDAPVVQILTSATRGVIATPDPDKWMVRRWLDLLYLLGSSFFENTIPNTIKNGNYKADTTSNPYNSLLAYKGRSLNGIWATAPYLHNGSVPTLYDLLLPQRREGDDSNGEYRPDEFLVGSREFDPIKIGFRSAGYEGFEFKALRVGDMNSGHEYGAGRTRQLDGTQLPALTEVQRWELVEYLKTL